MGKRSIRLENTHSNGMMCELHSSFYFSFKLDFLGLESRVFTAWSVYSYADDNNFTVWLRYRASDWYSRETKPLEFIRSPL